MLTTQTAPKSKILDAENGRKLRWLLAILTISVLSTADGASLDDWVPPIGVPYPAFGVKETHMMFADPTYQWDYGNGLEPYRANEFGPFTHYVDNTHPNATETDNPFGTPEKPRTRWDYPLPAGAAVQVHGGPYDFKNAPGAKLAVGGPGTRRLPIFLYGTTDDKASMPTISSNEFYFYGDALIVERLRFARSCSGSTRPELKGAPVIDTCVRNCFFDGTGVAGKSVCVSTGGSAGNSEKNYTKNLLIFRNEMRGYGDWKSLIENDSCGVIASQFATDIWILENSMYHMGGDGVRLGADQGDAPSGGRYYVGRNHIFENRENAIDVKQARDSVISENVMHGFSASSSSSGEAVIIHYGPDNIWFLNNRIYDSDRGLVSSGVTSCYLIGNHVYNCRQYGMQLDRGGGVFHVANNTIVSCDSGIVTGGVVSALLYRNNIVADITSPTGYHLQLSDQGVAGRSTANSFLFYQSTGGVRINWAGKTYTNVSEWISGTKQGIGSLYGSPKFMGDVAASCKLAIDSPAKDAGIRIDDLESAFGAKFGVSMLYDCEGEARPSGRGMDIGADELRQPQPSAPKKLRISP